MKRALRTLRPLSARHSSTGRSSENLGAIREEFSRQAAWFQSDWSGRSKLSTAAIMDWVTRSICATAPVPPGARALDVAAGTGIFARALAPHCGGGVVGLDATDAMLAEARGQQLQQDDDDDDAALPGASGTGGGRIEYVLGDAADMPFASDSFDLVACRLAIHHFARALPAVQEMARVCKPGGRVVVVDFISDDDEALAAEHNRLEQLRDPSHTRSLSCAELHALLEAAGLCCLAPIPVAPTDEHGGHGVGGLLRNEMDLERWMAATKTAPFARIKIERSFETELQGGSGTGMYPQVDADGKTCFVHKYVTVQATKMTPDFQSLFTIE